MAHPRKQASAASVYIPEHFREPRSEALHALIRRHPLATLIASVGDALAAEHLPLRLVAGPGVRAIVGFEIEVSDLTGKFKSSQNRSAADRAGVIRAPRAEGVTAEALEQLVRDPSR